MYSLNNKKTTAFTTSMLRVHSMLTIQRNTQMITMCMHLCKYARTQDHQTAIGGGAAEHAPPSLFKKGALNSNTYINVEKHICVHVYTYIQFTYM